MFLVPLAAQDTYDIDILISGIDKVGAPRISGDYVIFTAENSARHVGIAFDFEKFRTIHSFQRLNTKDVDDKVISSLYFYILEVPPQLKSVSYRLVVDGLWTTDPGNPQKVFNQDAGITLSKVDIPREQLPATEVPLKGTVKFVYQGESGKRIRVGGSFTNWDSYIYELTETAPGLYELELPLPRGTYYYAYYEGISSFVDLSNPERAYTADGRTASVITVR
ncbi:protein P26 [Treponema brennaborense DSM 12168]|uniref:Protein P26 n=2 Tax=Treponema TaxID=157 RepID=F4LPT1_TREBD|nr:protein P26 [Treponema brennaborense DSM 12168]